LEVEQLTSVVNSLKGTRHDGIRFKLHADGYAAWYGAIRPRLNDGKKNLQIEAVSGRLSDHYDPRDKTLRLSDPVFNARSVSAIGVACHEAGHALQHATGYKFLQMRSKLVPVTNLSSKMSMPVLMIGMMLLYAAPTLGMPVVLLGCALFAAAVVFSVVTLPVEWDASARAKTAMVDAGIVSESEAAGAGKVLNAAFLTYLASAIASILTLLYYLHRAGLLGGRR